MTLNIYYVYVLLNPLKPGKYTYNDYISFQYEPFYIGYGKKDRIFQHFQSKQIKDGHNRHLYNTISKILNITKQIPYNLILINKLELINAKEIERHFIKIIGRKDLNLGPLCNLTDGGDGSSGYIPSLKQRNDQSKRMKGIPKTEKQKENMRKPKPEGFGQKISDARKGIKFTDEHKQKISNDKKQYFSDPNNRDRHSLITKKRMKETGAAEKISASRKGKKYGNQTEEWINKRITKRQRTVYMKKLLKILNSIILQNKC